METTSNETPLPAGGDNLKFVTQAAVSLPRCVKEAAPGVPLLRFTDVAKCRKLLVSFSSEERNVDRRTVDSRIKSELEAKDTHRKKVGHKTRCYIHGDAYEAMLSSKIYVGVVDNDGMTDMDRCRLLDIVGKRFQQRKQNYWDSDWSLTEEIAMVPLELRRYYIFQMASGRKSSAWHAAAIAGNTTGSKLFPLYNRRCCLPTPSIEECLRHPTSEYSRAYMLLCVRALKAIEPVVFARTRRLSGPLTVCMSIAAIVGLFPSFRSVENALGLGVSYNTTENHRLHLISEREKAVSGAWDDVPLGSDSLSLCQFDNWDVLPLHAVKVDGKTMPKANGSLVQVVCRKRKIGDTGWPTETQRHKLEWKDPSVLGSRMCFADSFTSSEHSRTLDEFFDIVCGLVVTTSRSVGS